MELTARQWATIDASMDIGGPPAVRSIGAFGPCLVRTG